MMELSPWTIKGFMVRLRQKTGCHKTALLVMWAVKHGIVTV